MNPHDLPEDLRDLHAWMTERAAVASKANDDFVPTLLPVDQPSGEMCGVYALRWDALGLHIGLVCVRTARPRRFVSLHGDTKGEFLTREGVWDYYCNALECLREGV